MAAMTHTDQTAESLLRRLKHGSLWTALGRISGMATVFVLHVFLARNLPTGEYATFVLAWSWTTLFSLIGIFGLNTLACRYLAESFAQGNGQRARQTLHKVTSLAAISVIVSAVSGALLILVLPTEWLPMPELAAGGLAIGLWIALLAVSQIQAEMFRGLHHLCAASLLGGMSGGLLSNVVLLALLIGSSCIWPLSLAAVIWSIAAALAIQCVIAFVAFWRVWPAELLTTRAQPRGSHLSLRGVASEALPIMTTQVTGFGVAQFDIWVVGILGGAESLAIYAVARRLALLVAIPVNQMGMIVSSFIPELYVQQRRQALASLLKGASTVGAILTVPLLLTLVFAGDFVLGELFGPQFASGATALRWFCLGQFVFAVTGPSGPTLMMTGHQRAALYSMFAPLPVLLLAPVAIQHFGSAGIAALVGSYVASNNALQWYFVRRRLGLRTEPCLDTTLLRKFLMIWRTPRACRDGFPISPLAQNSKQRNGTMKKSEVLVCLPCFNSEQTVVGMVESLLANSDADLLLIDDHSDRRLAPIIRAAFPDEMHRITVNRPEKKVFSGGAKNIGMWQAIEQDYVFIILLDSDLSLPDNLVGVVRSYFRQHADDVLVAPSIEPAGNRWQRADTLINFSTYLPLPGRLVSRKNCLAGYAFAINVRVFRENACFHNPRYGGEDVLFFHELQRRFGLSSLPLLNQIAVKHLPPRRSRQDAKGAQRRYGRAFFAHSDGPREQVFNSRPVSHLLTPRFLLMFKRLVQRRRFLDLLYLPLCWYLDLCRARQIMQLCQQGYQDPARIDSDRTDDSPVSNDPCVARASEHDVSQLTGAR